MLHKPMTALQMQTLTLQIMSSVMMQILHRSHYGLLCYSTLAHLHTLGSAAQGHAVQCSAITELTSAHQAPIKALVTLNYSL